MTKEKTHCLHGHRWIPENLHTVESGRNYCRICREEQSELRKIAATTRTHCFHGHPWVAENLYLAPIGKYYCRACRAESAKNRIRIRKQQAISSIQIYDGPMPV